MHPFRAKKYFLDEYEFFFAKIDQKWAINSYLILHSLFSGILSTIKNTQKSVINNPNVLRNSLKCSLKIILQFIRN